MVSSLSPDMFANKCVLLTSRLICLFPPRNQLESTLNNLYVASDYLSKMKLKSEMIFVTSR